MAAGGHKPITSRSLVHRLRHASQIVQQFFDKSGDIYIITFFALTGEFRRGYEEPGVCAVIRGECGRLAE